MNTKNDNVPIYVKIDKDLEIDKIPIKKSVRLHLSKTFYPGLRGCLKITRQVRERD